MVSEDVHALWEPWMVEADTLLDDEELLERVYQAQGSRPERSHTRGRPQTPAEIVLRLLLLSCSSTSATGATTCWSGRFGPTWSIGISHGWA